MAKQNPKPRSLRAQAFYESQYPVVQGFRCVKVLVPNDDRFVQQLAGMVAVLTKQFNYQNLDPSHAKEIAAQWLKMYVLNDWGECCEDMNCEELAACLAPYFESIATSLAAMTDTLNTIGQYTEETREQQIEDANANKIQEPLPISRECGEDAHISAGVKSIIGRLNDEVQAVFTRTESEAPDRIDEVISIIGSIFTGLFKNQVKDIPVAEAAAMGNWYFENQVEDYNDSYDDVEFQEGALCKLYCMIANNDCTLTHGIISTWLKSLRSWFPGNRAADVFARFGDAAQPTLQNQIGMFLQQLRGDSRSITDFYDELLNAYDLGAEGTDNTWENCDCTLPAGCYDQNDSNAAVTAGSWVASEVYGRVAQAAAAGGAAIFEIDLGSSETLASFSIYTRVEGATVVAWNTVKVELLLAGVVVATPFDNTNVNDGNYAFPGRGVVNSTVGNGTSFDKIRFTAHHTNGTSSVAGSVCTS